ncbi:MAG: YihY/virulence factor BrkB family protein [Bacteroidota bacterium]|nr:YihY/virulence factor BrkB family protein [Bacteroidota bacterium]
MLKRLFRLLRASTLARGISRYAKNLHPWGFEGLTLYEVAVFFGRGISRVGLRHRAASMAYNFFIALFPSIIFLFTLIPFIPIDNFQTTLLLAIKSVLPGSAFITIQDTITEIILNQNSKLLSFGFLAALYFSTAGVDAMMDAFNKSIHVKEKRRPWKQQLVAVLLVVSLTFTLLLGIGIIIGTQLIIDLVFQNETAHQIWLNILQWLIVAALFMFIIAIFYRFGPSQRMHKHFLSPGVFLATILMILTSLLFAWYVNNFGRYNALYGSIGSIIVVLIWIYYNSMMLVIGFELDAGIEGARDERMTLLEKEDLEIKKEEEMDGGGGGTGDVKEV